MSHSKAFTLVELMIVVVIIGILASLASANFGASIRKSRARDARNNLIIIHSANLMYKARNGQHCTDPNLSRCDNLTAINSMNGPQTLNISASGATYACSNKQCTATATKASDFLWTLKLENPIVENAPQGEENNPLCQGTYCP